MKKLFNKLKFLLVAILFVMTLAGVTAPTKNVQASVSSYTLYKAKSACKLYVSATSDASIGTISKNEVVLYVAKSTSYRMKVVTLDHGTGYVYSSNFSKVTSKSLNVSTCVQETTYYCGPATVQEVLKFYGVNKSQKTLASDLGTTTDGTAMSRIPRVLNKYQKKRTYKYYNYSSKADFEKKVLLSVANGYPVVIDIRTTNYKTQWGYSTKGHFMCISGFNTSKNTLTVNDPHYKYYGKKTYSADLVYNVVNAHPNKAIIY